MPELSDADILNVIGFIRGFTASDEEADRAIAHMRQAITLLPESAHCAIDSVVPFVTAVAVVLTSVPMYDGQLPLELRIRPTHVRRQQIAQVAQDIMGLTQRAEVGSSGVNWALEIALHRGWLRDQWPQRSTDPGRQEVEPTIVGRRNTFTIEPDGRLPQQPLAGHSRTPVEYVTRDQLAALCRVSKDTIERWMNGDDASPSPVIEGGGGRSHKYDYAAVRAWIEPLCRHPLPPTPPVQRPR